MVTRTRLRAVLTALGLYTVAALIIGYFGLSAYTGAHGLKAKQDLAQQQASLMREIERTRAERKEWEHGFRCCAATISIPTCSTSARGRSSTTCIRATSRWRCPPRGSRARLSAALRGVAASAKSVIGAKPWGARALTCARFRSAPNFG